MKVVIKIKRKDPKKEFKCDKCGASSMNTKMQRKKTFPHGRKSKPVYYNKCKHGCNKKIQIIILNKNGK